MTSGRLYKVLIDDKVYYILARDVDSDNVVFTLAITDCLHAWTGTLTRDDLAIWSRKTTLDIAEYQLQTRQALSGGKVNSATFDYELQNVKGEIYKFIWKKIVENEDIKFQFGSATVQQRDKPSEIISSIFDDTIEFTKSLQTEKMSLECDRDKWKSDTTSAFNLVDNLTTLKQEIEANMFSKFVTVLNDKKAKLRELKNKFEGSVDDESVEGKETSDDDTDSSQFPARLETTDEQCELDLMLDDGNDIDVATTSKRARKKETKKPMIPLVPRTSASNKKNEKRKLSVAASHASTGSQANRSVNADALIDDMA